MRIKMLASMAAPDFSYQPKQEIDVSDETGAAWIAAGIAEPVENKSYDTNQAAAQKGKAKKK